MAEDSACPGEWAVTGYWRAISGTGTHDRRLSATPSVYTAAQDELERMWKEAVLTYLRYPSQHLCGKNYEDRDRSKDHQRLTPLRVAPTLNASVPRIEAWAGLRAVVTRARGRYQPFANGYSCGHKHCTADS
jgi:hypothetical protein